jgi:hypothetical protein
MKTIAQIAACIALGLAFIATAIAFRACLEFLDLV